MSYQALARKWRPQRFNELVGQEHIVRALQHGLANDRLHHALLFSGTRGVGKTTLGRLVAKGLNCELGVTAEPCGTCTNCVAIEQGRFVDLIEVDAASRTGVDDTRELLNNVQYAPAQGRCKVYLIDEVHMLSKSAFNALLKTLEEPPEHVRFLLATTDPQRLPITVLSRCLQFHLKRLPRKEIQGRLQAILDEEKISYETVATELLAKGADGSLRDGISLLDQAIAFGHGKLESDEVAEMLGSIAGRDIVGLLDALASQDGKTLFAAIEKLDEKAPDYALALAEMAATLQRIAVMQLVPELAQDEAEEMADQQRLGAALSPERVQLLYQIAITGKRDLPLAPDTRSGFEMTLLRMLAFSPVTTEKTSKASSPNPAQAQTPSVATATAKPETPLRPDLSSASDVSAVSKAAEVSSAPVEEKSQAETPATEVNAAQTTQQKSEMAAEVVETLENKAAISSEVPAQPSAQAWADIVGTLGLVGMADQLARHCAWTAFEARQFELTLSPSHESLFGERHEAALLQSLQTRFGVDIQLKIALADSDVQTPTVMAEDSERERQKMAEQSMTTDPNVQALSERLGAQLHPGSVEALD